MSSPAGLQRALRHRAWLPVGMGLTAVWLAFSSFQEHLNSDGIVQVLTSLQRWTPFYWQQDRYGMLVPLLALPIRTPLANLLFQSSLVAMAGLGALYLALRYVTPDREDVAFSLGVAAGLALLTLSAPERFDIFGLEQPYSTSMALTLAGLFLVRDGLVAPTWRSALAIGLVALGSYVSIAVALAAGPLILWRAAAVRENASGQPLPLRRRVVNALQALGLVAFASVLSRALSWRFAERHLTAAGLLPITHWPAAWVAFLQLVRDALTRPSFGVAAFALGVVSVGSFAIPAVRRAGLPLLAASGGLVLAALACLLATGSTEWVSMQGYAVRYATPSIILLSAGVGALVGGPVKALPASVISLRGPLVTASLLAMVAAAFGLPGPARVRTVLSQPLGPLSEELIAARATHLAGNYWSVWMYVFWTNQLLEERGEHRQIFGLTGRALSIVPLLTQVPPRDRRIALLRGDPSAAGYLSLLGHPPISTVEQRHGFTLVRTP